MEALITYLQHIRPLSPEAIRIIQKVCPPLSIRKGRDLQSIGQTCRTIYFIEKGCARIYYYKDGTDVTEYFAFENNLLARVESLFTGKPSLPFLQRSLLSKNTYE